MPLGDRIELFLWSLVQLACYGLVGLAALALLTRPQEAAALLLGERGVRAVTRLFRPIVAALGSSGVGQATLRLTDAIRELVDTVVERVFGRRDAGAAERAWRDDV
jgi:hypothetical protein